MSSFSEGEIFIANIEKKSLECRENNEIVVLKICELCNIIYPIFNKIFGNGFLGDTLKKDLKNSSSQVQRAIEKFPEETKYVSMLYSYNINKYENMQKLKRDLDNGIISFLWMKRTLDFIITFLEKCYITYNETKLSICAQEAYNEVLKKYHGFITTKIVKLCLKLSPTKEILTKKLGFENHQQASTVLEKCLSITKPLVRDISVTIERFKCDFEEKI
ncbi:glycolipid transfer protein, putative [Plasmodium sp. DRC-Itaito]|nr:glycolipid transfer protein, putative [Plasmodium sp. DRC-Itaito]